MKKSLLSIYLVIGLLTILEYLTVRGMFTSFICMGLVAIFALINIVLSVKEHRVMEAMLIALSGVALIAAYLPFLA